MENKINTYYIIMKKKGKKPKGAKVMAKSLVKKKAGGSVS